ncbi:uncharacterized protein LOC116849607 [Odontomachus brunneus]|uniref:uncharacterized protein LOC116849607 n=1 Tax=Odontomachus brunneus TaxID=486640 RepID=UPI0013F20DBC|nr:uncharacterized protein LOC116849607 [Odontomachus brunneus]
MDRNNAQSSEADLWDSDSICSVETLVNEPVVVAAEPIENIGNDAGASKTLDAAAAVQQGGTCGRVLSSSEMEPAREESMEEEEEKKFLTSARLRAFEKIGRKTRVRRGLLSHMLRVETAESPVFHTTASRGSRIAIGQREKLENVDETGDNDDNDDDDARTDRKGRAAFIFYDFETRQEEMLEGCANVKTHVVTLCVAQQTCEACLGEDDMASRCRWCGMREFVFRDDPVKQFVDFATRTTKRFFRFICIAHNAAAFDSQFMFILRYLVESGRTDEPKVILNGTKIVLLTVGRTKFLDSANYMPMRLSALPKAFGLKDSVAKGVFPHLFNTIENQNYISPLPDIDYYSPDTMKSDEREQFLTWHVEMTGKNAVFNFQREIVRYCRNDVDILRRACLAYQKIFLDRENVCPFEECTTIASTCMKVFRKNFLREKEIGIIGGYRGANAQSRKALQWLLQMEYELGRSIIHAGRGRERRLLEGTLVDGYYETENPWQRHVLQFHGCFWHECPECFRVNRDRPLSTVSREDTIEARYERILATTRRLRKQGYVVTEKWECIFDRQLRENREIREFVENHPMLRNNPLEPREAFHGGRTENIITRYEVTGTEKIRYVDVCSLYPYVLKTGTFPLGHPDIYVDEECCALIGASPDFNFDAVEGLVRCRVLAPRDLFHPVLPYRVNGKLLFALCRSCCETFSQAACTHDPADREFEGAWVSCELRKAIEKGYCVTSVSEIWSYEVTRYDPVTRRGGLFTEYINCFLQLKQEASGWPNECANDEGGKERYLREYEKVEGIVLNRANISPNPGLRSVAKLCLNSFWGKFGQRSNLPNTEIVRTWESFAALLTSPEHEITNVLPVNDEVIYVSWRMRREAVTPSPLTSVAIAAYTTALVRLKLYSYLEKLDRRVLYYDTDSCIYLSTGDPDEYDASIKSLLLTDKKLKREEKMGEDKTVIKLRFSAIRRTVFHDIITRDETKSCMPVLLKRSFNDNGYSVPYGYVSSE